MSRSGYREFEDCDLEDILARGRWKAMLKSSMRGKRGRAFLTDLRDALDAMPAKRLISSELVDADGEACAIGCVGLRRGADMSAWLMKPGDDPDDFFSEWECDAEERAEVLGQTLDIATCLAQEVMSQNDDCGPHNETPEQRWIRMHRWVSRKLGEAWNPNHWHWDANGAPVEMVSE